jgi:transcriptional regulator
MNFLQGTLDLLLLNALADGPLHGYDIVEQLREKSGGVLDIEDGALYTSLHRMERRGWLDAQWRISPKGRRAKYYQLTREGQTALRTAEKGWNRFSGAVGKVFSGR